MKQCIALAALACLLATGCAQMRGTDCGDSCHVATSRRAPRPLITRDASRPSARLFANRGCCTSDCDTCSAEGCTDGSCCLGGGCQGGACGACDGCSCGGPCSRLAERVASGMCCGGCAGMGGHGGTYPEYPTYNPGPPVGQVAYPYYTTRGPRDFLMKNPPSIGPY